MDKWFGRLFCRLGFHWWGEPEYTFTQTVYVCRRCHKVKEGS